MSEQMQSLRQSALRRRVVFGVFALLAAALLARAFQLQAVEHDFYRGEGEARQLRTVAIPAHRGSLLDRDGEPLAVSTPIQTLWAEPTTLAAHSGRLPELAAVLGLDAARLAEKTARAAARNRRFMYVSRHIAPDVAQAAMDLGIDGVSLRREYRRYYPSGPATAHLIGFADIDDRGREGLELAYEDWLRGVTGERRVVHDLNRREIDRLDVIAEATAGRDLRLSIDRQLQYVAYRALSGAVQQQDAEAASLILMDVRTGELLAISNYPSYNPNQLSERSGRAQRNQAITDVFEPGSTMKPFAIAAALESGRFAADDIVYTSPGSYTIGKYLIRDTKDHGWLDLRGIIRKSSNVGMSKVASKLDPVQMWSVFDGFGFGRPPGSEFPGEVAGHFNHASIWHRVEQASVSYGYGISVSALQLVRAYAALANDGLMVPVSYLKLDEAQSVPSERVVDRQIAAEIRGMLESVVAEGTGHRAGVPGYRVAGKTGTSHRSQQGGYAEDRYISLFAGFAPVAAPRLAAVVVVHDPKAGDYFGSLVAAPIFADVMSQALRRLNIEPDDIDAFEARALQAGPIRHRSEQS